MYLEKCTNLFLPQMCDRKWCVGLIWQDNFFPIFFSNFPHFKCLQILSCDNENNIFGKKKEKKFVSYNLHVVIDTFPFKSLYLNNFKVYINKISLFF